MEAFLEVVKSANDKVNSVVWGWPALILLCFTGVLMTVLTKFYQVSHFKRWVSCTIGAIFKDKHITKHTDDKSISQFQSLCTALAATVGTGNIAGVASAIATGGPGSIFWMWVVAFFGFLFLCIVPVSLEIFPFIWIGLLLLWIAVVPQKVDTKMQLWTQKQNRGQITKKVG